MEYLKGNSQVDEKYLIKNNIDPNQIRAIIELSIIPTEDQIEKICNIYNLDDHLSIILTEMAITLNKKRKNEILRILGEDFPYQS